MGRERQGCPAAGMGRLIRKSEPAALFGQPRKLIWDGTSRNPHR